MLTLPNESDILYSAISAKGFLRMSPKEDLRVIKTKKALAEAFMQLLSEKSFEDITVNELCESAGIRRATFYKHFTDKFQYLASFTRSLRDNFDSLIWKSSKPDTTALYYTEYVNRILIFIKENQKIIENIMQSGVLPTMISVIMEQNYRDTLDRLRDSVSAGMYSVSSAETVSAMFSGGVTVAIYMWLVGGMEKSTDELASEINAIISATIGER